MARESLKVCQNCQTRNVYRYDWTQACCLVRFLLTQPNNAARHNWLKLMESSVSRATLQAVRDELNLMRSKNRL